MIRNIRNVLVIGVRSVFHNIKFITLFWIFNAASAVILSVPIFNIINNSIGRSLISDKIASTFDYFWFLQFRYLNELALSQIPITIYTVVVIYTVIQTFFLGGLIAVFNQPKKNHTVDFFYGGVKYFYRFLKVLLVSTAFYAVAFIINDYLGELISWFFIDSESIKSEFVLRSLRYILLVFLIGLVTLISDYVKVSLAIDDKTKILRQVYYVIIYIKNNFTIVFTVFLIVACLGAFGAVVYNIFSLVIPRTPYYFLVLFFILQQMLIIFRLFIRMLFCATEVTLYKDLSAEMVNVEVQ